MNYTNIISQIAEDKINIAMEKGEFDNLKGQGEPLNFEDLGHIPEELRMAYKILKNAGCLPEELSIKKEINNLCELLDNCNDEQEQLIAINKLKIYLNRLNKGNNRHMVLEQADEYYQKILAKITHYESKK